MKKVIDLLYIRLEVVYSFWVPSHKGDKKGMHSEEGNENAEGTQTM